MRKSNGVAAGTMKWGQVKTGGLGWIVGGDISADGTLMACWADVGEAYVREMTTEKWDRVITSTRMTIPTPAYQLGLGDDFGVYGMAIAPSSASVVYLAFRGRMLRSTNRGVSFSDDSLNGTTGIYMTCNSGNNRQAQHKLKVDPSNAAVAYLGTQNNGLWRRLTAGWAQITSVPVAPDTNAANGDNYKTIIIAVDATSATTGAGGDVRYSIVFASVNGKGIYKSTDGGTTFSQIVANNDATMSIASTASCTTNGTTSVATADTSTLSVGMSVSGTNIPAGATIASITNGTTFVLSAAATGSGTNTLTFRIFRVMHMIVGPAGNLFVVLDNNANGNVYKSTDHGSTFTQMSAFTGAICTAFEFDPKTAGRMTGVHGSSLFYSLDSGATIVGPYQGQMQAAKPTACPLPPAINQQFFSINFVAATTNVVPHPTLNRDYLWGGWGVFYLNSPFTSPSTVGGLVWVEDNKGVEELVTYSAFIHPVSGRTFLSCGDRGLVWMDGNTKYASHNYPPSFPLTDGTVVDYAIDDPTYLVTRLYRAGGEYSGYSTNGGDSWNLFGTTPLSAGGGAIAVSNKNQIVSSALQDTWPRYSTSSTGASWSDCTFAGYAKPSAGSETGFGFSIQWAVNRHALIADKQTPGAFYILNYGPPAKTSAMGVWESLDGGANFTWVGCPAGAIWTHLAWHATMFMVQGDLYLAPGKININWVEDAGFDSWRSTDKGRTWTALGQLNNIVTMAWGKAAPGSSVGYALYAIGWKSGVFGLYRSDDKGVTWLSMSLYDHADWPRCIAADPLIFGRVVVGYVGSGYAEGLYDFPLTVS